jgi:hypothetical protein
VKLSFDPRLRVVEPDREGGLIADAIRAARGREAAREGLHCSTIVNDILRHLYPAKYGREIAEHKSLAYQEFGNAIEDVAADALRRRYPAWTKPPPRCHRGIWGSPDGWSPRTKTIDEIKATWVSMREFEESVKLIGYLMQALFYVHVWQAKRLRLHVLFVVGAYPKGAPVPESRTFVVRWDDESVPAMYAKRLELHARDRGWL